MVYVLEVIRKLYVITKQKIQQSYNKKKTFFFVVHLLLFRMTQYSGNLVEVTAV